MEVLNLLIFVVVIWVAIVAAVVMGVWLISSFRKVKPESEVDEPPVEEVQTPVETFTWNFPLCDVIVPGSDRCDMTPEEFKEKSKEIREAINTGVCMGTIHDPFSPDFELYYLTHNITNLELHPDGQVWMEMEIFDTTEGIILKSMWLNKAGFDIRPVFILNQTGSIQKINISIGVNPNYLKPYELKSDGVESANAKCETLNKE